MAFKSANLSVIAYANGWTMWHYSTIHEKDTLADIMKDGYFDKVFTLAATGDIIIIVTAHGTVIRVMELTNDKHIKLNILQN